MSKPVPFDVLRAAAREVYGVRPIPAAETDEERGQRIIWDQIETAYALRSETALWWEEGYALLRQARREAEMRQREAEALARARAEHEAGDVLARASAYIAQAEGGIAGEMRNPRSYSLVVRVVRGFALDEAVAVDLLATEYAPRCKPRLPRRELIGMVRRASRAPRPPWGYLLNRRSA